jgi:hypothetical protein
MYAAALYTAKIETAIPPIIKVMHKNTLRGTKSITSNAKKHAPRRHAFAISEAVYGLKMPRLWYTIGNRKLYPTEVNETANQMMSKTSVCLQN